MSDDQPMPAQVGLQAESTPPAPEVEETDTQIPEGRGFRETTIKTSNSWVEAAEKLKAKGLYTDRNTRDLSEVLRRWGNRNGVTTAYVAPASANARNAQRLQLAEAALEKLMHISTDVGENPDATVVTLSMGRVAQVLIDYDAARKPLVG